MLDQKNGRLGIRMSKNTIDSYNKFCKRINSIPSIRIRKFIEYELELNKVDILKEIEKKIKNDKKI